jgi:sugar phosphate isomerase/epimerase
MNWNRREFLIAGGMAAAGVALAPGLAGAAEAAKPRIVVFSKIFQSLNLNFEQAAELTAEAGLDGIDCPLRPKGEIEPEKVDQDLPKYLAALKSRGLVMPMIASGITGPDSPYTERTLRALAAHGVKWYRLAPVRPDKDPERRRQQVADLRARIKDLAAMSRQLGVTGLVQNHSPREGYLAGDVGELCDLLQGVDPREMGAALDLGHGIVVHHEGWKPLFERARPHLQIAYVKDVTSDGKWIPFGEGEFSKSGYFTWLKKIGYQAPYSLHIEFDWDQGGKERNRATLLKALRHSTVKLREWIAQA